MPENTNRSDIVRNHLGSLAIAGAIVIAASVYGFVSSRAYAVFFMGVVGFLVCLGFSKLFGQHAAEQGESGSANGLISLGFLGAALFVLFSAVFGAMDFIRS